MFLYYYYSDFIVGLSIGFSSTIAAFFAFSVATYCYRHWGTHTATASTTATQTILPLAPCFSTPETPPTPLQENQIPKRQRPAVLRRCLDSRKPSPCLTFLLIPV